MEDYDMKKIKSKNKPQRAPMKDSTKIFLYSLAGIILLLTIVLVAIENLSTGFTVNNASSTKLEYVRAYFVDTEGPVNEDKFLFENINGGEKNKKPIEKIDLSYRYANLEIRFKLEGQEELFVDAGYFNEVFDGRILVQFEDMDNGNILLKVKAKAGVIPSPHIDCDEEHIINLTTGEVEE